MPGFDGSGPRGQGPLTGGRRGYCTVPYNAYGAPYGGTSYGTVPRPASVASVAGRPFFGGGGGGWGRGRGRGRR